MLKVFAAVTEIDSGDRKVIECFTWRGSEKAALAEAHRQAREFGYICHATWATPVV